MLYLVCSRSSPHTGNVLLKCVVQWFQWFGTMLLPDTSFLLNVNIQVFLWFMMYYCSGVVVCCFCFCQSKHFVYLQVPLLIMLRIGCYSTQPMNIRTHQEVQEIRSFMLISLAFFFCPIYAYFRRITCSLPFVTHIQGHMARTSLSSPLLCVPSFNREKKNVQN